MCSIQSRQQGLISIEPPPLPRAEWDDPCAGTGSDLYVLSEDGDSLDQVSKLNVGGKHVRCVTRYKRVA